METQNHPLTSLFEQLGLGSTNQDIHNFLTENSPIPSAIELHDANFWSASQASFLKHAKEDDADWAEIVDHLNIMLRST